MVPWFLIMEYVILTIRPRAFVVFLIMLAFILMSVSIKQPAGFTSMGMSIRGQLPTNHRLSLMIPAGANCTKRCFNSVRVAIRPHGSITRGISTLKATLIMIPIMRMLMCVSHKTSPAYMVVYVTPGDVVMFMVFTPLNHFQVNNCVGVLTFIKVSDLIIHLHGTNINPGHKPGGLGNKPRKSGCQVILKKSAQHNLRQNRK